MKISKKINKKNLKNDSDYRISIALMASFVILTIQYFVLISFNSFETTTGSIVQMFSKILVALSYLYALPKVLERSLIKSIIIYMIALFVFITHYAIFPENRIYIFNLLFPFFLMCLPAFIYSLSIRNFEIFKEIMKKSSYIVFMFGILIALQVITGRASVGIYSMTLSYYILLPAVIFLDELIDNYSLKYLILTTLSLLIILGLGSRGAILCILTFVILKLIRRKSTITYKNVLKNFTFVSIGVIGFIFIDKITLKLYNILLDFGIRSRTLMLLMREEVYLSGRENIYGVIIESIIDNAITGIGIAGDNYILSGGFPHNIVFEFFSDFGLIIGSMVLLIILFRFLYLFFSKDSQNIKIVAMWISLGFVHLLVSSTYMTDIKFWIFLGLMFNKRILVNPNN